MEASPASPERAALRRARRTGSMEPPLAARIHASNASSEGVGSYRKAYVSRGLSPRAARRVLSFTQSRAEQSEAAAPFRCASVRDQNCARWGMPSDTAGGRRDI